MEPFTVVAATANPDKLAEISGLLVDKLELLPRPPEVPDVVEDADTLVGNARLKAVAIARHTGQPALADDTGLFVDALGGAPGVHSARFAGEDATYQDNVDKLLEDLTAIEPAERTARFSSVMLIAWPDGSELWAQGDIEGVIVSEPRGDNGFGYDPVFSPVDGDGRTYAELSDDEKQAGSHRARAIAELIKRLP